MSGLDGFDIPQTTANRPISIKRNNDDGLKKHVMYKQGLYNFEPEPPHILNSALKNNPISGITLFRLIRLLYYKRKSINWWRYKHRIVALILMGFLNSFLSFIEFIYFYIVLTCNPRIRRMVKIATTGIDSRAPIFILGHPRTGTTLLHSLLALDEERFTFCDTFMAGFPHCFLFFENIGKFLFSGILSKTRPMDNMKLHFDLPQEDELATNLLAGFMVSPYSSIAFMRDEKEYRKYQCFREHDTNMQDINEWVKWFLHLLEKIKIRDVLRTSQQKSSLVAPRQLLLKSPCHTGRARLLLKLFPDAKFIFIHRDPYEIFLSGAHMASTTYGYWFLQEPTNEDIQEYILAQGEILHNEFFSCVDDGLLNTQVCLVVQKVVLNVVHNLYLTNFQTYHCIRIALQFHLMNSQKIP